ncbi:MAG: hypothetical protein WCC84_12945 [Candidatus Cybelea sp.]
MKAERLTLSLCAAVLLAGCGGSQALIGAPGAMPHGLPGALQSTPPSLLYVVGFTDGTGFGKVFIYNADARDPRPKGTIAAGLNIPTGDCLDKEGTLYVENEPASGPGWVSEYPAGQTQPSKMITEGINSPAYCAIDGQGNLWVTNIGGPSGPNVTEYKKGSTKPYAVITKGLTYADGIAIDHSGNLYVSNLFGKSSSPGNVQVYPPGRKAPSRTITDGVTVPVGIGVDKRETLYVTNNRDTPQCSNVQEYRAGQNHPYRTITKDINGPTAVTVGSNGWLYVTNTGYNACSGPANVVLEFRPGSITPSKREISKGLYRPEGTAYFPPLLP